MRGEVFAIQGAIFDVNHHMGAGFLEGVYQECLALEFAARGIPFVAQKPLPLTYKGRPLRQTYLADFVCFDAIIIELKAVRELTAEHRAQVLELSRGNRPEAWAPGQLRKRAKARIERLVR